jgi:hypothetical protein
MADKTIDIPELANSIVTAVNTGVEDPGKLLTDKVLTSKRAEGIKPSIPGKYNPDTGKVVLMDAADHAKECADLIQKGIIPLTEGYIYIDKQAFDTMLDRGMVPPDSVFEKARSNVASDVGVLLDTKESGVYRKAIKADPFVSALQKKVTHVIQEKGGRNTTQEQAEKDVKDYLDRGSVSPNAPSATIRVIYRPVGVTNPKQYYTDSILFDFKIKRLNFQEKLDRVTSNDFQLETPEIEDSSSLEVLLQNLNKDITGKQQAGHLQAVKTTEVRELLRVVTELLEEPVIKASKEAYQKLEIYKNLLIEDEKELEAIDKFFGNAASYYHPDTRIALANLRAGANQLGLNFSFKTVDSAGKLRTQTGEAFLDILYEIEGISTPESAEMNSWAKGSASTQGIILRIRNGWKRAAEIYLKQVAEEEAPDKILDEGSNSLLQAALIVTLGKLFDTNLAGQVKKSKRKNFRVVLPSKKGKRNRVQKLVAAKKRISIFGRGKKRRGTRPAGPQQQQIVSILNSVIKGYVIEQMNKPALEQRSGRFAESVKILSHLPNNTLVYTYRKSPYLVFDTSRGKDPWNRPADRNPGTIINNAINKATMDKFGKVFRTEER